MSCARIEIAARTDAGVELVRTWRTDESALGAMSAARMTQRVRWQLEGWLTASALARGRALKGKHPTEVEPPPAQALTGLTLTAQYVAPMRAHQEALWGRRTGAYRRAQGAVERIQDLLGPQAVLAVAATGGRTYQERVATRWWAPDSPATEAAASWPGQLPSPAPASLLADPWDIDVLDRAGRPLRLSNRLALSGQPYAVVKTDPRWRVQSHAQGQPERIGNWAGPWPIRTGWWTQTVQHCVYLQLELPEQPALLVVFRAGAWLCEGIYD